MRFITLFLFSFYRYVQFYLLVESWVSLTFLYLNKWADFKYFGIVLVFEFSDVSQSIHKYGFWQSVI